jgi:hypothetical protein
VVVLVPKARSKADGFANGEDAQQCIILLDIEGDLTHVELRGPINEHLSVSSVSGP